jgi:hypothetical protein
MAPETTGTIGYFGELPADSQSELELPPIDHPRRHKGKHVIFANVPRAPQQPAFPLHSRYILHKLNSLSPGSFQNPDRLGTGISSHFLFHRETVAMDGVA